MFANELRSAIESAPRMVLGKLAVLLWRAFSAAQITEAEADELSNLIEIRKVVPKALPEPHRKAVGSRPITNSSLARRRRWAASGRLPPALAALFTQGEAAVLAVIAETVVRHGDCRHCNDFIAALAGVSRSMVKNALRQAKILGLITVEQRRLAAWRNDTNIVRIVSPEWQAWNRLKRRSIPEGGGVKSVTSSNTKVINRGKKRGLRGQKGLPRRGRRARKNEPDENQTAGYDLKGTAQA
jgi:hypothetical protein